VLKALPIRHYEVGVRNRRYDTTLSFVFSGWTLALGIALMAAGGTLAFACIATFVTRGEGTAAPSDCARTGTDQRLRTCARVAILLFSLPWLLLAHLFVVLYEEPHLRATFGSPYDAYCRSVPAGCLAASRFTGCPVRLTKHLD
jgi:protein-S-isoprenylcysteine O-methyltransferase Ste14